MASLLYFVKQKREQEAIEVQSYMEVTTAKGGGNSGEEMEDIEGKVALITGASSGLGRVFSVTIAERGCNVIIAARRTRLLESLCDEINALTDGDSNTGETGECSRRPRPGRVAIVEVDVSKDESVIDAAVEKAWTTFGVIDILVNNAGFRGILPKLKSFHKFAPP